MDRFKIRGQWNNIEFCLNFSVGATGFFLINTDTNLWRRGFMSKFSILAELWLFLKVRKKWWLAPILIFLFLLAFLIVLTEGSALAPFIYALF
jgi:hypothetical protein